ncbi:MAG TPA: hypothetical protein VI384_00215 [Candidatus Dormibacteraeota bacterium]
MPDLPALTDPAVMPELVEELLDEVDVEPEVVLVAEAVEAVVVDADATPGIVSAPT